MINGAREKIIDVFRNKPSFGQILWPKMFSTETYRNF